MQLIAALVAAFGAVALAESHLYMRAAVPQNSTIVPPPTNVTHTMTSTPGVTVTSTPGATATTTTPVGGGGGGSGGSAGNSLEARGVLALGGVAVAALAVL